MVFKSEMEQMYYDFKDLSKDYDKMKDYFESQIKEFKDEIDDLKFDIRELQRKAGL